VWQYIPKRVKVIRKPFGDLAPEQEKEACTEKGKKPEGEHALPKGVSTRKNGWKGGYRWRKTTATFGEEKGEKKKTTFWYDSEEGASRTKEEAQKRGTA